MPGDLSPATALRPSRTAQVDGYQVTLIGLLTPLRESRLTLEITRDGQPVTTLQPYLEAFGHLVALRVGDLGYLHVHPSDLAHGRTPSGGPDVGLDAVIPSAGAYHLYFEFKDQNVVHTAEFLVSA